MSALTGRTPKTCQSASDPIAVIGDDYFAGSGLRGVSGVDDLPAACPLDPRISPNELATSAVCSDPCSLP